MTEQSEAKIQEEEKHFYRKPSTVRKIANLPRRPTFAERISDFFMRIVNPGAFEDKSSRYKKKDRGDANRERLAKAVARRRSRDKMAKMSRRRNRG